MQQLDLECEGNSFGKSFRMILDDGADTQSLTWDFSLKPIESAYIVYKCLCIKEDALLQAHRCVQSQNCLIFFALSTRILSLGHGVKSV